MWGSFRRFGRSTEDNSESNDNKDSKVREVREVRESAKSRAAHLELGRKGEKLATRFLRRNGYVIVATNFIAPIGYNRGDRRINAEIDIIAYDRSAIPEVLSFVEVKTRTSDQIASPQSAVDLQKQRQIVRAARVYRRLMAIEDEPYRYDVIGIVLAPNDPVKITLLRDYFTEERFARSNWSRQNI